MTTWLSVQDFVWGGAWIVWLLRRRASLHALWLFGLYIAIVLAVHVGGTPDIALAHALGPAHITVAFAGKMALIAAVCLQLGACDAIREVRAALILECASIALGMFWALDAPNWGALWQWDRVEMASLWIALALFAWSQWPRQSRLWAWICLILVVLGNAVIYGGILPEASRHEYAQVNPAYLAGMAAWCLGAVAAARWHAEPFSDWRCLHVGAILLCCGTWTCFGRSVPPWFWAALAAIAWSLTQGRRWGRIAAGLLTIACLCMPAATPWQTVATTEQPGDGWTLEGIRVQPEGDCYHYRGFVAYRGAHAEVPLDACGSETFPTGFGEIRDGVEFYRAWGTYYRAAEGMELWVRPVTRERWFEVWILIIWLCGTILAFRQAIRQSGQAPGSQAHLPVPDPRRLPHRTQPTRESRP